MRIYLEAVEVVNQMEEGEFIRLDVTNKTEEEQSTILTALKDFMVGVSSICSKHNCYHDERGTCTSEVV